jgi:hypothetical protein
VSLFTSDPLKEYPQPTMRPVEILNECLVAEICIDDYLWSLYERTPKTDTNKVLERVKVKVKKKGKTRTVIKTITKYVVGDFTWKDPIAAQRAGMSLKDYVIGGIDRVFKLKLYRALRAMDDAGLMPGITSATSPVTGKRQRFMVKCVGVCRFDDAVDPQRASSAG